LECYESQESNGGSESGQLFAIPTHLYLDPTAGYPDNNSVHPNSFGYQQIGSSAYSWLKWWLEQQE
jgi:hypothetical protein